MANGGSTSDAYFIGPEPFRYKWIVRRKEALFETLPPNSLSRRFLNYSSKRTHFDQVRTAKHHNLPCWEKLPQLSYAHDRQDP
jgi:hypothetical protein